MPQRARSRMVVATIALQSVGLLIAAAVAVVTLRLWSSPSDWRMLIGGDRRRGRVVPADAALASGKSPLAHRAWTRRRGTTDRRDARRLGDGGGRRAATDSDKPASGGRRARHGLGQPLGPAFFATLPQTDDARFGAVVLDGRRHLRGRVVHAGHSRRHPHFIRNDRSPGGGFDQCRGHRGDRPVPPDRLPHRAMGGAALRSAAHAGR